MAVVGRLQWGEWLLNVKINVALHNLGKISNIPGGEMQGINI